MEARPHRSSSPPITTASLQRERTRNEHSKALSAGAFQRLSLLQAGLTSTLGMVIWGLSQHSSDGARAWRAPIPSRDCYSAAPPPAEALFAILAAQNFPGCSLGVCLRSFCWAPLGSLWLYLLPMRSRWRETAITLLPDAIQAEETW